MLLAEGMSPLQLIVLGLLMLVTAFLLRRNVVLRKRSLNRDPLKEVQREMLSAEKTAVSRIRKMEVRLHNYSREVEGRVQTKITTLDRLIEEADREITRLRGLVEAGRNNTEATTNAPPELKPGPDIIQPSLGNETFGNERAFGSGGAVDHQRRMIIQLGRAGYSAQSIAELVTRPLGEIQRILDESSWHNQSDAA